MDEAGLIDLWEEIEQDPAFAHLRTPGINLVPGIGSSRPLAMVVGEAPGATENSRREPFCGASGRVLHELMGLADLFAREDRGCEDICHPGQGCCGGPFREAREPNVWLTNAVKYRPQGNRTPNVGETLAAQSYLRREWYLIGRPRLIICVGSTAANTLNVHIPSAMMKGELYRLRDKRTWVSYQYHPAWRFHGDQGKKQEMMQRQWEHMGAMIQGMRKELRWDM